MPIRIFLRPFSLNISFAMSLFSKYLKKRHNSELVTPGCEREGGREGGRVGRGGEGGKDEREGRRERGGEGGRESSYMYAPCSSVSIQYAMLLTLNVVLSH